MKRLFGAALLCVAFSTITLAQDLSFDQATMLKADQDLNQAAADRSLERFLALVAEDATFAGGGRPVHGRSAVGEAWAPYFQPGGPTLTWAPNQAEVLVGHDVGYTIGTWTRRGVNANGDRVETHGEYLTVWQKQTDGQWLAVYDTGSAEP
jgi:ketosteroid isomerase-like protein